MTIDNTKQIKKLIEGCEKDEFYMLQIIHRTKDGLTVFDGENKKNVNKTIKTYFISSPEYLDRKMDEIKELCHMFNARAYINLNRKSCKQVGLKSIELLAHSIAVNDYSTMKSVFESACGQTGACDKNKSWIVDADTKDTNEIDTIKNCIEQCEPFNTEKIIDVIQTLHGYHIISRPFNKEKFRKLYQKSIDIHDNNPTLLYYREP